MKDEIDAAAKFIIKLIKQNSDLNEKDLSKFQQCLRFFLTQKFSNHWHPERPWQGQGYRCLRVNGINGKEPTIAKAASECGLKYSDLKLPLELTVWIDPDEVCCRFGEHKGSYCTVASFREGKKENYIDKIDLTEMAKLDCTDESNVKEFVENGITNKSLFSTAKSISSGKENIAPMNEEVLLPYSPNAVLSSENILKSVYDTTCISNRVSGRIFNGNSTFSYKEQHTRSIFQADSTGITLYNPNENATPYYKPSSWMGYPASVSPPQPPLASSSYYDYSPPHFSSQDNLNFNMNRLSPVNLNKLRWSSGPYTGGNAYSRNGWYMHRQLARV